MLVTYHYSRGEKHRGCAGFNYDTDKAVDAAQTLKKQFDRVYGTGLHKMVCGIETDLESLVLHGEKGQVVDLAECPDTSTAALTVMLTQLYPSFPERVILDLLPLVEGNIRHIRKIRGSNRPIQDSEHKEWVLGVGRGFDWLHLMNTAFIVGPYNPDLSAPIGIAGKLLSKNFQEGRVPEKNMVLLVSAGYRSPGPEQNQAEEKSRYLTDFSLEVLKEQVPDLLDHLQVLTATVDFETRKLDVLSRVEKASELSREMVGV